MELTRAEHRRKIVAGWAIIVAPLLAFAGAVFMPTMDSDEAKWLTNLADGRDRAIIGLTLTAAAWAVGVFAVLGLAHLLRERMTLFGLLGSGFAILGMVASTAYVGVQAMSLELAGSDVAIGTAATLVEDTLTGPAMIFGLVGLVLFAAGMLVLTAGLYRARVIPIASAVGLALFAVAFFVGYQFAITPVVIAATAVLALAAAPIGWAIVKETDQAWEHAPQFRGFHPVPTT
ncbi:MAG TPA: hypothetical protein VI854_01835 [Acidimicrobiia bacterium]|nr:hypothetical protein [Acidimicrobiia bacterium]